MNPTFKRFALWAGIFVLGVSIGRMSAHQADKHFPPAYGNLGLPKNCSAYVDATIAGYRTKTYSADEAMAGLERNCSSAGALWRDD